MSIDRCHREALAHQHPGMVLHYNDDDHRCCPLDDDGDLWDLVSTFTDDGSGGGLSAVSASGFHPGTGRPIVLTVSIDDQRVSEWQAGRVVRLEPSGGTIPDALRLKLAAALN